LKNTVHREYKRNFRRKTGQRKDLINTLLKKIRETGSADQRQESETEARAYWRERDRCGWTRHD